MKAITMRMQKFSRPGVILLATVVAIITSIVVANATQTITTPNAVNIPFSLAAGANSAPITPVTNKSVLVMGCGTTNTDLGVGQVSLISSSSQIRWSGVESFNGSTPATTGGATATAGTHIVFIDFDHMIDIQVAGVGSTILVHNGEAATRAGNVTLIW